jgi:hypothetical protein
MQQSPTTDKADLKDAETCFPHLPLHLPKKISTTDFFQPTALGRSLLIRTLDAGVEKSRFISPSPPALRGVCPFESTRGTWSESGEGDHCLRREASEWMDGSCVRACYSARAHMIDFHSPRPMLSIRQLRQFWDCQAKASARTRAQTQTRF